MPLEDFIAGHYAMSYEKPGGTPVALGLTKDGIEMQFMPRGQAINESDAYGGSLIDGVDRGHDTSILFTLLSFKKAVTSGLLWQRTTTPSILTNTALPVGRLWSSLAGELVAVGVANTPAAAFDAASTIPNVALAARTMTASLAYLSPASQVAFQMTSKLRELPVQLVLLPYADGSGNVVHFIAS
jgi:hypothetical protein